MKTVITLYASGAKPHDIYLRGTGIAFSRVVTELFGGKDSVTTVHVAGTVITVQPGTWARKAPPHWPPLWKLLKAIRDYLESKARD